MKRLDLSGQRYGRLIAIDFVSYDNVKEITYWLCKCDCGNEKIVNVGILRSGKVKSCGCLHKESASKNAKSRILENHGAVKNALYLLTKNRAIREKHDFLLSKDEFFLIVQQNCVYCGCKPSQSLASLDTEYLFNGIDRINSDIGYTIENSAPCCKVCNRAKNDMTVLEFEKWIDTIAIYRGYIKYG